MYNTAKIFIGAFIVCFLSLSLSIVSNAAETQQTLAIGDYIEFGAYNDEPVLWRVIHIDEEGDPLLFSEYIISYKSFDAMELDLVVESESDTRRHRFGSNRWSNSNLREWLNSSEETVAFSTHPPTRSPEAVLRGLNAYANEPGFLTNFTQCEKEAIKETTHKSLLMEADKDFKDGGSEAHIHVYGIVDEALTNYENAYYEEVTDKVFLLSVKELKEYVQDRNWDIRKVMTRQAKLLDRTGLIMEYGEKNPYSYYWLRTPASEFDDWVRKVDSKGMVTVYSAYKSRIGVSPALFLSSSSVIVESGAGTSDDPFILSSKPIPDNSTPSQIPLVFAVLLTSLFALTIIITIKKKRNNTHS